eukprot:Skav217050  [mRNA]  locus=scaffold1849:83120:85789:+ [translate_table: standard]
MAVLDLLAAGITSLREIGERGDYSSSGNGEYVKTCRLNLHMNQIRDLGGISQFPLLEELILSGNCIKYVRPLDFKPLTHLKLLDLSCNELQSLDAFQGLCTLEQLHLAYNRIESLEGMMNFWGKRYQLKYLDLRCNRINELNQLLFLGGCSALEQLAFEEKISKGNPMCDDRWMYRKSVFQVLPWLRLLDEAPLEDARREPQGSSGLAQIRSQVAEATLELRSAEAKVATEAKAKALAEAQAAQAARERDRTAKEEESQREARLRADLEEIVVAVRKQENHFEEQLARLSVADEELPAAEELCEEEAKALAKVEGENLELCNSEKHEASLAARFKSNQLEEQMLKHWASERKYRDLFPDVQALQRDLQRSSRQLQEVRSSLKALDDELPHLAEALVNEQSSMAEAQREVCEEASLARCWNLETAAAAAGLAELRGSEAQRAKACAEEMEAQEMMIRNHQIQQQSLQSSQPDGELQSLVEMRDCRVSELKEAAVEVPEDSTAVRMKEKFQSVLDHALEGLEQSRLWLSNLESDLAQKAKALELAQKQGELDKLVLGEMNLQLQRRKESGKEIFLQVSQRLSDTISVDLQVHEVQQSFQELQKKIQELEDLRSSCVCQADYQLCVQASEFAKAELAKFGEEKLQRSSELEALVSSLEKRREELRSLVLQLQENQAEGEQEERKLKIKLQMIADAQKQVADLKRSVVEAEKFKQENDIAWRDRLTEATTSAEEYVQHSEELQESSAQQQEEAAKLSQLVKAKGERNDIVQQQLDHVQMLTEEQRSRLDEKVSALELEGGEMLKSARLASSEMEERFRRQRAEQLQEDRRQRCRLVLLQQQLQAAPGGLNQLRCRLASERAGSQERLRRLVATFERPGASKAEGRVFEEQLSQ